MEAVRETVDKLKFAAIWTLVGLAALVVLSWLLWPALLGFVAVLVFAIWRTRERLGWLHVLVALAVIAIFALVFWRTWLLIAMAAVIALIVVRVARRPERDPVSPG